MTNPVPLVEIWRGPLAESIHTGHAVICDDTGQILEAWGNPDETVYPRSAAKIIQALPMVESGAADAFGVTDRQLSLACASHIGSAIHTDLVRSWLTDLELTDDAFRCGPQMPRDREAFNHFVRTDTKPCQLHNQCSGKHAGFLTLSKHLGAGPEYIDANHPVQKAFLEAFETLTGQSSPGYGIDGCSAPNYLTTMHGMARAMAYFANAQDGADARQTAAVRLWQAKIKHPEMVNGEKRPCTEIMRACREPVAVKYGAEGYYIAIAPTRKLGIAVKISDGSMRAANCTIAALLVRLGLLDAEHPATRRLMNVVVKSRLGFEAGMIKPVASLLN